MTGSVQIIPNEESPAEKNKSLSLENSPCIDTESETAMTINPSKLSEKKPEDVTSDFGSCDEILSPTSETKEENKKSGSYYTNLYAWLKLNRMHKYYSILAGCEYDTLFKLSAEDLTNRGFTRGAVTKYLNMVEKMRQDPTLFLNAAEMRNKTVRNLYKVKDSSHYQRPIVAHHKFKYASNAQRIAKFGPPQYRNIVGQREFGGETFYPNWARPSTSIPQTSTILTISHTKSPPVPPPSLANSIHPSIHLLVPSYHTDNSASIEKYGAMPFLTSESQTAPKFQPTPQLGPAINWGPGMMLRKNSSPQPPLWIVPSGVMAGQSTLVPQMWSTSGALVLQQQAEMQQQAYLNSLMLRNALLSQQQIATIFSQQPITSTQAQ